MIQQRSRWALGALILFSSLLLFACGGSGGSSSVATGSVGILVTDAPSDDFDAIEVTLNSISLIADESNPIEIWSSESGEMIDLLNLETEAELFTLVSDVPIGWYNKIRLHISRVELVEFDGNRIDVDVPSRKIDLNPRGNFYVNADETLLLQLDFDANKSIHLVNANHYRLRPVVFVDIFTAADQGRLTRLPGTVVSIDTVNRQLVLLHQEIEYLIHTNSETRYFGFNGTPNTFEELTADDPVIIIGHFQLDSDKPLPDFNAVLVEQGNYQKIRGTLIDTPGADGSSFTLDAEGQLWVINLDPDTLFYDCFGVLIEQGDFIDGQRVTVDVLENVGNAEYDAALVVTCPETVDALSGELESLDSTSLSVAGQCAEEAGSGASYYLLGEDSLTEITRAELVEYETVQLFGEEDTDPAGCFSYRQLFMLE